MVNAFFIQYRKTVLHSQDSFFHLFLAFTDPVQIPDLDNVEGNVLIQFGEYINLYGQLSLVLSFQDG